jgi:predicted transcriptional regulator
MFGKDNGETLKAAIANPQVFNGFEKLLSNLEKVAGREAISKQAGENITKKTFGGNTITEVAAKYIPVEKLFTSTKAKKDLVNYLFTDEGKKILEKFNKASKKDQEMLTNAILSNLAGISTEIGNQ